MRYSRIIAAIVFTSALIFSLCITSFAAPAVDDVLYCEKGIAHYVKGASQKWVDFDPTVNSYQDKFTFSGIPNTITENDITYNYNYFVFLLYPYSNGIEYEYGYVYTYNFDVRVSKLLDPETTSFEFGLCTDNFGYATPLADVIYTYSQIGSSTSYNYYVTVTLNWDNNATNNSKLPSGSDVYNYLRIVSEHSGDFQLVASAMTYKKSTGEGAYYQASLDAIENLPNTEYDFTLNKMPDADGTVEVIKGQADDITSELNLQLTNALGVFTGISGEEPLIYMPKMKIPILNLDIADYTAGYISQDGYFRPLDMIQDMDESGQAMLGINLARHFLQLVFVFTFATVGIDKMLRIEWWF